MKLRIEQRHRKIMTLLEVLNNKGSPWISQNLLARDLVEREVSESLAGAQVSISRTCKLLEKRNWIIRKWSSPKAKGNYKSPGKHLRTTGASVFQEASPGYPDKMLYTPTNQRKNFRIIKGTKKGFKIIKTSDRKQLLKEYMNNKNTKLFSIVNISNYYIETNIWLCMDVLGLSSGERERIRQARKLLKILRPDTRWERRLLETPPTEKHIENIRKQVDKKNS